MTNPIQTSATTVETTDISVDILEQTLTATPHTERSQAEILLRALVAEALIGTVAWNKTIDITINDAIKILDKTISNQLSTIMHHEKFKQLEGSWRGLHHLVINSETNSSLKIKLLNIHKRELFKDLDKASEFDQSQMFKKVYEFEFGTPGGEPYGALVGDYEFSNHSEDLEILSKMSNIAASAFCPFISAASPQLFAFEDWRELSRPRDLEKIFSSIEYIKWQSLRESEDSRFLTLVLPRALSRLPYGKATKPIEEFEYEEIPNFNQHSNLVHRDYCWMNAAYVLAARLTDAFAKYGWCTTIRGAESGGRVNNLPMHTFKSDDGDIDVTCPTEIGITDRREAELSKLGFLPLCHYKNTDYAVFFGAQSVQKPKKYDRPEATANAAISARLPYIMATSRFAHYLKIMARDKIGAFMEIAEVEVWLNRWIFNYVNSNRGSGQEMKAKYPLSEAKVYVEEISGYPGAYHAIAWLRPWLQLEELISSMRLVAKIPSLN